MRLHQLHLSAIGPFAGQEQVDFARLGRTGLFLLEGPTGSGKSTVIDAVTFALYNKVAASSADNERIHSHHADPRTVPMVTLVFETQSGIYRIQRTPRFERPKSRGGGLTTQQPTVKLWRLSSPDDAVGELVSSNLGDAEDQITRAIGLTRDQFVQTVILPQGEFATFLRAKSEEKAVLLEKVFGTAFFRRVQDQAVEAGRAAEARRAAALAEIAEAIRAFAVTCNLTDEQGDELVDLVSNDPEGFDAAIESVVADLAAATAAAKAAADKATQTSTNAEADLHAARLRKERRDRLRELQDLDEQLQARRTEVKAWRVERERGVQASPVNGAFRTLGHAQQEVRKAATVLAARRKGLDAGLHELTAPELRVHSAALRRRAGALEAEIERERQLGLRVEAQAVAARDHLDATARVATLDERLADLPVREATLLEGLQADERAHALLETHEQAGLSATATLTAARAAVELAARTARLETAASAALGAARDAEAALAQLRIRRIEGVAGELGLTLAEGQPCPVCGSRTHPVPAQPTADAVTPEHLADAETHLEQARQHALDLGEQLSQTRTALATEQAASGGLSPAAAESARDAATEAARLARAAGERADTARAQLAELDGIGQRLRTERDRAGDEAAALGQRLADLAETIAADEQALAEARGEHPSVAEHARQTSAQAEAIDAYAEAVTARSAAQSAERDAQLLFEQDLADSGFTDVDEWFAARRSTEALRILGEQILEYDTSVTAVRAGLQSEELRDLALDQLFTDVDAIVALARAAKKEMTDKNAAHGSLKQSLTWATRRRQAIAAAREASAQVLAETADAVRVGRLVAGQGDNQLRMDLVKYVLIRRFTEVLAVANTELARFSGGRYALEHTDARQGNARSGLGIVVNDMHTNQVRDVGTLSGGETFYVSLSLALALAEVVRAESGGVDLGTLFVDEGFGTLDPDVLDDVMQTLEQLREGGRTVGIVSHVSELKARIADRIEVVVAEDRTSSLRVTA